MTSGNPKRRQKYLKLCNLFEKITRCFFLITMCVIAPCAALPYLFSSYFFYETTDMGRDAFVLPFLMWSIFDWKTPRGYFIAFTFEFIVSIYLNLITLCVSCLGFGLGWLHYHFGGDLKVSLQSIKEYNKRDAKTETDFYRDVCKFIQLHAELKQLSGHI